MGSPKSSNCPPNMFATTKEPTTIGQYSAPPPSYAQVSQQPIVQQQPQFQQFQGMLLSLVNIMYELTNLRQIFQVNQKFKWGDNYSGNRAFPFNKQTLAVYHCNNNHCIVWATCLTSASLTMEDGVCFNFAAPAFPWSRWANGLRSDRPASICLYGSLP